MSTAADDTREVELRIGGMTRASNNTLPLRRFTL